MTSRNDEATEVGARAAERRLYGEQLELRNAEIENLNRDIRQLSEIIDRNRTVGNYEGSSTRVLHILDALIDERAQAHGWKVKADELSRTRDIQSRLIDQLFAALSKLKGWTMIWRWCPLCWTHPCNPDCVLEPIETTAPPTRGPSTADDIVRVEFITNGDNDAV